MPKLKTHKGMKKRFKVTATGKVMHKKCGSSHLMSHKSGKQVRRLRKKVQLKVLAEAQRVRRAVRQRIETNPAADRRRARRDRQWFAKATTPTPEAEAAVDPGRDALRRLISRSIGPGLNADFIAVGPRRRPRSIRPRSVSSL